jgi:hypothetical protein
MRIKAPTVAGAQIGDRCCCDQMGYIAAAVTAGGVRDAVGQCGVSVTLSAEQRARFTIALRLVE